MSTIYGFILLTSGSSIVSHALSTPGEQPLESSLGGCLVGLGIVLISSLHSR